MQLAVTTIIFGLPSGQRVVPLHLTLPTATVTVQELIAYKVQQEVEECVAQQRSGLSGEYLPPEVLITAGVGVYQPGAVADEISRAQEAFHKRAYMIVVDNQRLLDPHAVLILRPQSQVEFIKILPLVGG
jgi:hypothetical protein